MRRRARVDRTQQPIRDVLHAHGWKTRSLAQLGDGIPDVLAHHQTHGLALIEAKTGHGSLTPDQQAFAAEGWPVVVLRSEDDAIAWCAPRSA